MKLGLLFGLMGLLMNQASADVNESEKCDALYANRGSDSLKAFECYLGLNQKENYQKMFIALSAAVNDLPKTATERTAIDQGLKLVASYLQDYGKTADYYYWKACFISFDVIQKDRGSIIPTNMFGVLGELQDLLQTAIKMDPSVHFYGPMRVLGMMHTQMPGIVGGDKKLAEKVLRDAYLKAPNFSMNHLAYAKILDINGRTDEAIRVINQYLNIDNNFFNPYPDQPLLSLLPETLREKAEAQKLLNDINE